MSLDLFAPAIAASDQDVAANAARDLPAGFSETFDVALRSLGEWHNSNAYELARERALASYYDDVRRRTGAQLPLYGISDAVSLADLNAGIGKLADQFPDEGFLPLSDADVDTMARRRMAKAHDDARAMQSRETTWGGTLGTVLGMTAGIAGDPVTIATLPLGGVGEAGIALRGLEFAAIAGGTEAATAALNFRDREAAVPGSSKEIPGEILTATLGGGTLGLAFGGLTKLLGRGAKALPTAARDDLNAVTSEAQLNVTNPFPTAAGEAAARDGVNDAVTSIVRGDAVRAGENFDPMHVANLEFSQAAGEGVPDGYVRFFHGWKGDAEPTSGGGRWVTSDPIYARDFRKGDEPNHVSYIDIPKGDPSEVAARAWDELDERGGSNAVGRYRHIELPEEWAQQLKPLKISATWPDAMAIAGEKHLRPETFDEVPDVERFDRLPSADDDAASYWENRLAVASPEERATLGATDARPLVEAGDDAEFDAVLRQSAQASFKEFLDAEREFKKYGDPLDAPSDVFDRYREASASLVEDFRLVGLPGDSLERGARPINSVDDIKAAFNAATDQERRSFWLNQRQDVPAIAAPDLTPQQMIALEAEPATADAVIHNLEHILQQNPDAEYTIATRLEDGTTRLDTMKLSDVLKDLDETERAAREIEACAVGLETME